MVNDLSQKKVLLSKKWVFVMVYHGLQSSFIGIYGSKWLQGVANWDPRDLCRASYILNIEALGLKVLEKIFESFFKLHTKNP